MFEVIIGRDTNGGIDGNGWAWVSDHEDTGQAFDALAAIDIDDRHEYWVGMHIGEGVWRTYRSRDQRQAFSTHDEDCTGRDTPTNGGNPK